MTETTLNSQQTERQDLFCHTDLNHPVMKILFDLPLADKAMEQAD